MKKKLEIGLLGGSFNPPHYGHLWMSKLAMRQHMKLDEIWWIVAPTNPLKIQTNLSSLQERVALVRHLISRERRMIVREESYVLTIDLVVALTRRFPLYRFHWIMGADSLLSFHEWEKWQRIASLTKSIIVIDRNNALNRTSLAKQYLEKIKKLKVIRSGKMNISSTEIRLYQSHHIMLI